MADNNIGTTKFGATPMTKEQKNNVEAQFKMDSTLMHLQDTLGQALKSVEEISYDVDTQPATHSQMNKSIEVLKGIQDSVDLLTSEPKADSELRKSTDFLREAVVEGFKVLGDVSVMNSKTITDSLSNHINNLQDEVSNLTFNSDELDVNVNLNDYGIEVDISSSQIEVNQDDVVEKIDGSIDAIESVSNQINSNSNILKTFLNRVLESLIVKGKEYDSDDNPDNQEKVFKSLSFTGSPCIYDFNNSSVALYDSSSDTKTLSVQAFIDDKPIANLYEQKKIEEEADLNSWNQSFGLGGYNV